MLKKVFENEGLKARNNPIIKPYIIAEAGVNHEGDMDTAFRLIAEAREGGADAIKFQTYKAEHDCCKEQPELLGSDKGADGFAIQAFSEIR